MRYLAAGLPAVGWDRDNMPALGFHIIWTTYGTWLPGDNRGHWSPLFDMYGQVLKSGGQLNMADATTRSRSHAIMNESAKRLTDEEQQHIASEMGNHVSQSPGDKRPAAWAATIESHHVHLLIGPLNEDIATFTGRIKGRTSSVVSHLQNTEKHRTWTAGYWKVFLFNRDAVKAVKRYIENHNLRRGLSASPYSWLQPWDDTTSSPPQ